MREEAERRRLERERRLAEEEAKRREEEEARRRAEEEAKLLLMREVEISYRRSFMSRYIQAGEPIQAYYTEIKNALLSYKGVKARTSWSKETFRRGRAALAKIDVKGKSLYLYLALDPATLEGSKYRTTAVKGLHIVSDFEKIGDWIAGARKYFIQQFIDSGDLIQSGFSAFDTAETEKLLAAVRKNVPNAESRGI